MCKQTEINDQSEIREKAGTTDISAIKTVFDICEAGLIILNVEARVVHWNQWMALYSGITFEKALGETLRALFPSNQNSRLFNATQSAIAHHLPSFISHALNRHPLPLFNKDRIQIAHQIIIKPFPIDARNNMCLIQIADVSSTVKREQILVEKTKTVQLLAEKLSQEKERAQVTLQSIADGVITTDAEGKILSMNSIAELLTGWPFAESENQPVSDIFSVVQETNRSKPIDPIHNCLASQTIVLNDDDLMLIHKNGSENAITLSAAPIRGKNGEQLGTVLVFKDVSQARELTAQLKWQARHDPLTGLVNRRVLESELNRLLESAKSYGTTHSLLYIDLDQFKVINDTCGHVAGDELLRQISTRLQANLRNNDILARLGGDEFGILLEGCKGDNAYKIANTLRQDIQDFRFAWNEQIFKLGVSIGLVHIDGKEQSSAHVLSAADSACYVAKDSGRNRVHVQEAGFDKASGHQKQMQWISRIQSALDADRFCLYVQCIASVSDRHSSNDHYKILLRMIDTNGELIGPGAFIPAAERFNKMQSIDRWVIHRLFHFLEQLDCSKINSLPIFSINLSGASLSDENFLADVQQLLGRSKIPTNKICFEITETAAITNLSKVVNFITALKASGCSFSLDDFGSGLSSFAYLKKLPVDYLKIDGYFVKDIENDPFNRAFVESINQIGHILGLTTIAEFVENRTILGILKEIGVDFAQGYGIGMPFPLDKFMEEFSTSELTTAVG